MLSNRPRQKKKLLLTLDAKHASIAGSPSAQEEEGAAPEKDVQAESEEAVRVEDAAAAVEMDVRAELKVAVGVEEDAAAKDVQAESEEAVVVEEDAAALKVWSCSQTLYLCFYVLSGVKEEGGE